MKRRKIIILIILLLIIIFIGIAIGIDHRNKIQEETKIKNQKRYDEIKNDISKELERYLYVVGPKCQKNGVERIVTHESLVYTAGMDKEKFLDVDGKSYCKAYVNAECVEDGKWGWNIMLSCKDYEDEGYINWDKGFEPKG